MFGRKGMLENRDLLSGEYTGAVQEVKEFGLKYIYNMLRPVVCK